LQRNGSEERPIGFIGGEWLREVFLSCSPMTGEPFIEKAEWACGSRGKTALLRFANKLRDGLKILFPAGQEDGVVVGSGDNDQLFFRGP
jgi:hypothetical protein